MYLLGGRLPDDHRRGAPCPARLTGGNGTRRRGTRRSCASLRPGCGNCAARGAEAAPGIDLVERLATALGVPIAELLPATSPDPLNLLKQQAERRFQSVIARADRATLMMLNPWLAVLDESLARGR